MAGQESTCLMCGRQFQTRTHGRLPARLYCSRPCYYDSLRQREAREPFADRFWRYVSRSHESECWPWIGGISPQGYGHFWVRTAGRQELATRVMWELMNGPIPSGAVIRHACHWPTCVNPSHLRLGTQVDNYQDAVNAGRMRLRRYDSGADHPGAKLTVAAVRAIRKSPPRARGDVTEQARRYGVSRKTILNVLRRHTYGTVS